MSVRKQQLLKQHRRNKRVAMLVILVGLLGLGYLAPLWVLPLALVGLLVLKLLPVGARQQTGAQFLSPPSSAPNPK